MTAGFSSQRGRREQNQDYVGLCCDGPSSVHGHTVAMADGVSLGNAGRIAAELTVRSFLEAHYGTAPTAGIARSAARNMAAINSWLHSQATTDPRLKHASTTFTAVILADRSAHVVHVGDSRAYLLQDEQGQIQLTHSVSAGLDYAAVGPEHAWLRDLGRAEYGYATDDQALAAFTRLARCEGIIPALESAHAVAAACERVPHMAPDQLVIVNLSGRGDKDVAQAAARLQMTVP